MSQRFRSLDANAVVLPPCTILPAYDATVRGGEVLSLSSAVDADALNIHLNEDGFITRAHVTHGVIPRYALLDGRKKSVTRTG
jgi:hypothetical protein